MKEESTFRDLQQRVGLGKISQITCGYFDCTRAGYAGQAVSPPRKTTRFEIEYFLSDGISCTVDEFTYPIKEHHILITKPGQLRFSQLPFRTMYLKFSAEGILADRLISTPTYFLATNTQKILELFTEINILYDTDGKELIFHSEMLELLDLILTDSTRSESTQNINIQVTSAAKKYINENYSKPISLKNIADAVSLSPNHFHTIFKATCQMTPHEYLMNRRIAIAKEMLWDSKIGLSEIAEKSGFGCQQYFSQAFKKKTGLAPGKYRKRLQQDYLL